MTPLGRPGTAFEHRVEGFLATIPEWRNRVLGYALAAAPVASPIHRATASDCVRIDLDGEGQRFLKIRHADSAADVAPGSPEAYAKVARLGLGPELVLARDDAVALAFLPEPWRCARVGDLQDPQLLARALDAKKALHSDTPLGRTFCPFERIDALWNEAMTRGALLPDGTARLVSLVRLIREAIEASGKDSRFCHNDGVASNIMLDGRDLRLVDMDLAGDNDVWFDVGALINETCVFDDQRRAAIEHYAGRAEDTLLSRCRLYGAVDDVMWGLWGVVRAATSARTGVEFYKYGTWRLFRARVTTADCAFEAWLRRL